MSTAVSAQRSRNSRSRSQNVPSESSIVIEHYIVLKDTEPRTLLVFQSADIRSEYAETHRDIIAEYGGDLSYCLCGEDLSTFNITNVTPRRA